MSTPAGAARPRALLLESIHDDAAFTLREAGFDVERVAGALGEDDLVAALPGVHVLGLRSNTQLTAKAVAAADALVAVGAFCIGTNQIDLAACSGAGVAVFNAPFSNTRSVVELALSEIIALTRRLTDKNAAMHAGVWDKSAAGSHEVRGRRLGIVGYGNIGSQLSVLAEALGMSVLFFDTADKLALGNARRCGTLEELLSEADVVSLHVDGRAGNSVNLPQVSLPMAPGTVRLLLLHTNTPGVLATVNGVLADHGLNIEGQLLGTSGGLGYVVTDVAALDDDDVTKALGALPETLRLWVLP
jgi:D-3-phosphoglycerate dehydrogenase